MLFQRIFSLIYYGNESSPNSHYEKFILTGEVKCIDDEIPFELPNGWEWCRIKDISRSYIGLTYKPEDVSLTGAIVLRSSNVKEGKIVLEDVVRVSKKIPENLFVETNDIIICARNGSKKLVGKSALVTEVNEATTFGAFMAICKTSLYSFVYYFLQSELFFTQLSDVSSTTTINQLTQTNFNHFLVPLPPLVEQQRIVAKIEELMPLVEQYGKAQSELNKLNTNIREQLKKSILQYAIEGKLVAQCEEDGTAEDLLQEIQAEKQRLYAEGKLKKKDLTHSTIFRGEDNKYYEQIGKEVVDITEAISFDIPNNWIWTRIGYLFAHNNGKQLNKSNSVGTLMEYITTSNLYWDGFKIENLKSMPFENHEIERYQAIKGDLLVCEGGDIGRSCIWINDYPIMLQNHIHKLRSYSQLCIKYFFYIFYLYKNVGLIGGKGIGIQGFSAKALHNTIVPLPPLKEQERIVEKIDDLLDQIKC